MAIPRCRGAFRPSVPQALWNYRKQQYPPPERLACDSCVTLLASVSPFRASYFDFDFDFGFPFSASRPFFLCLDFFGSHFPHSTYIAFSRFCDSHAVSNLPRHHECGGFFSVLLLRILRMLSFDHIDPRLNSLSCYQGFVCPSLAIRPPKS